MTVGIAQPTVIGISGPSCSGKSTLARGLLAALPDPGLLEQDLFFRDPSEYPPDANFCELRWLHTEWFLEAFAALASGDSAEVPTLDYRTFRRTGSTRLTPSSSLIVEGMTIFRLEPVLDRCDVRVYLDVDFSVVEPRKRERDLLERGKAPHIVEAQLAWMRAEYERDAALRDRPDVLIIPPGEPAAAAVATVAGAVGVLEPLADRRRSD